MAGHAKTLNPRQFAFVHHLVQPDGTMRSNVDAYALAGYKANNRAALARNAARTAQLPIVANAVAQLQAELRASVKLTAEHWERELLAQYTAVRDDDRALAAVFLDKWAKRLGLYEATDSNLAHSAQILTGLAALMAQSRPNPPQLSAPVTVEATIVDAPDQQ